MTLQAGIAIAAGIAATVEDLSRRRISNWIPAAAFVSGFSAMTLDRGWRGAGSSLLGCAAGFAVFLVFYLLGGMGGGDVKLMAGFGAILGVERLLDAALWTAGCGGLIALITIAGSAVRNRWSKEPAAARQVQSIPYAPAIALGALLALVPKA